MKRTSRVLRDFLERVLLCTWRACAESVEDRIHRDGAQIAFFALLLIAAASGVMGALRHAINQAWDIHARPPLLRRKALDVTLVLGATVVLALSLSLTATRRAAELLDDEAGGGWLAAALLDLVGDLLPYAFTAAVVLLFGAEYASEWTRLPAQPEVRRELAALRSRLGRATIRRWRRGPGGPRAGR